MSELKRCPICNGEVMLMFMNEKSFDDCVWDADVGNVSTWFKCFGCDSEFFHDEPIDTPEKQIEWWNTRIPMQNIVERLEEQAEECRKYWQEFNDEDSFGGMNAYCDAVKIVKEEGGMHEHSNGHDG